MSSAHIRYSVAACQTDMPNPVERRQMRVSTDRMLSLIDSAVIGSRPFLPVRLVVFPEFAHSAPVFSTVAELLEKLAVSIPNEHTDLIARKARDLGIYVQTGSMIECDPKWPGVVFNTERLFGLQVPAGTLVQLDPREHTHYQWLPYQEAAHLCFSPSNAEACALLPRFVAQGAQP